MNATIESLQSQIDELSKRLSAARRQSSPERVSDYTLLTRDAGPVKLSALFAGKPDLLIVHNMGRKCPYCTLWADGINGLAAHLADRAGFALASPDEPAVLKDFALGRGWKFPTVSTAGSTFTTDLGYEPEPGKRMPGVSGFRMNPDGTIDRTGHAPFGPGDGFCAAWPMLDLLDGGPKNWEPKYRY